MFGWSYLCCHLITSIRSGITGKLVHEVPFVPFVRIMDLWNDQHNQAVGEVPRKKWNNHKSLSHWKAVSPIPFLYQDLLQVRQRGCVGHYLIPQVISWVEVWAALLQNLVPVCYSIEMAFNGDKTWLASDGDAAPHPETAVQCSNQPNLLHVVSILQSAGVANFFLKLHILYVLYILCSYYNVRLLKQ